MPRFHGKFALALAGGLLLAGCANGPGTGHDLTSAGDSQAEETGPKAPQGLLEPTEAEPGMLYIRRRNADYTLELLLDTSSVNTAYDIELPPRSGEK